jgi:GTP cyclohydrolase IIa
MSAEEIEETLKELYDEIGIGLKAGIGKGNNAEDAAYMADIGLENIRECNNEKWIDIVEKEYKD